MRYFLHIQVLLLWQPVLHIPFVTSDLGNIPFERVGPIEVDIACIGSDGCWIGSARLFMSGMFLLEEVHLVVRGFGWGGMTSENRGVFRCEFGLLIRVCW